MIKLIVRKVLKVYEEIKHESEINVILDSRITKKEKFESLDYFKGRIEYLSWTGKLLVCFDDCKFVRIKENEFELENPVIAIPLVEGNVTTIHVVFEGIPSLDYIGSIGTFGCNIILLPTTKVSPNNSLKFLDYKIRVNTKDKLAQVNAEIKTYKAIIEIVTSRLDSHIREEKAVKRAEGILKTADKKKRKKVVKVEKA